MPKKCIIAASILAADFAKLGAEITAAIEAGVDWIHLDVMDNHYVPNLSIGPMVCAAIKPYCKNVKLDVHLMISPVDSMITSFAQAGADIISFHPEASLHIDRSLNLIKSYGLMAGLALNPATTPDCLSYVLNKLDLIMLMTVNPGFGGQSFIPTIEQKIKTVKNLIINSGLDIILEIDGGVKIDNINQLTTLGANALVVGSALFNSLDYKSTINSIKQQLNLSTF